MECGGCGKDSVALDSLAGEYYCKNCGLVAEQEVDYSLQWKEGAPTSEPTSFTMVNKGLGTPSPKLKIFKATGGFHLKDEPFDKVERSFVDALPILKNIWSVWQVPSYTKERSAVIYRKCIRKGLTKGRNLRAMSVIATWLACEEHGISRNLEKTTTDMEIGAHLKSFVKAIRKELYKSEPKEKVSYYLNICAEWFDWPSNVREQANELLNHVLAERLEIGKHPAVVAGAIVYETGIVTGAKIAQGVVANVLEISERSIRRMAKELGG